MPGWEVVDHKERESVLNVFDENKGIAFAHGFDAMRKHYYVRELEERVAQEVGAKYCQAVSSGSAGLYCALRACGVGGGDEVITSCFTFIATIEAILLCGAVPVCVDIDLSFNLDPEAVKGAITERTKCIIPVHMAGAPAAMGAIIKIADDHKLYVVEDACQAMGATAGLRDVGTIGHIGVYSLDAGKVIQCGEGGLIVTNFPHLFAEALAVHDHGHTYSGEGRAQEKPSTAGFNFRMTELQAAYALAQLRKLPGIITQQKKNKQAILDKGVTEERIFHGGDAGDCIIKVFESPAIAQKVIASMKYRGVGTKNIPDALNWHFAQNWDHIFPDAKTRWNDSAELLSRAVAIPVPVIMAEDYPNRIREALLEAMQ